MKPDSNTPPNPTSIFDRVRAWALGLAGEGEVTALRHELERDPEAAGFADNYREIHEMTRALRDEAPQSRLEFAALQAHIAAEERELRTRRWRKVAAAAVILVAAGAAGWMIARLPDANEPLRLSAIPLALSQESDRVRDQFPDVLASYAPVENGEIRWIPDVASGESIARAAGRPMLLFGMFPTCPWCQQMKAEGLRDPAVVALMEEFVPVQVNLFDVSEEERAALMDRGYPLFEVWNEDGQVLHAFPGFHDAPAFIENLSTGADKFGREDKAPAWSEVQRLAREYDQALQAEDAGQLGLAEHRFATLDRESAANAITRAARRGLERIAADARATLLAARAVAQHDARGAERDLADASRRFEGSRYHADLEAARERLARDGRFPQLATTE